MSKTSKNKTPQKKPPFTNKVWEEEHLKAFGEPLEWAKSKGEKNEWSIWFFKK